MGFNILAIVVAFSLVQTCLSQQPQNILFDDLSATVTGTAPNYLLSLLPPNVNDPAQQWTITPDGFIVSVLDPRYVFDIPGSSNIAWTRIDLWPKKPAPAPNQQWIFNSDGSISSQLQAGIYLWPTTDNQPDYLVIDYAVVYAHVEPALNVSWYCDSTGDPHIYSFPRGRLDLTSLQVPGDYILAISGNTTVYAHQTDCAPGFYCNEKIALITNDYTIVIQGDNVTIDGEQVAIDGYLDLWYGVSITRSACSWYDITVPGGSVSMHATVYNGYTLENVYIEVDSGPEPTGGLCSGYVGPLITPSRFCVRSVPVSTLQFANSWKIPTFCDNPFQYASVEEWESYNPVNFNSSTNATTDDPVLLANALALCIPLLEGFLTSNCTEFVEPAPYYQACVNDVIASTAYEYAAPSINSYATRCGNVATKPVALPTSGNRCFAYGPLVDVPLAPETATYFIISARDAMGNNITHGGDTFEVISSGPAPITFTIVDLHNGTYLVTCTPQSIGNYSVSVLYRGVDQIADSPFSVIVQLDGDTTDPAASYAYGPGLASTIYAGNSKYPFWVVACTSAGVNRTTGGDTIAVSISGLAFFSTSDNGDGSYTVVYAQQFPGAFTIDVLLNGLAISGAPFNISAQ